MNKYPTLSSDLRQHLEIITEKMATFSCIEMKSALGAKQMCQRISNNPKGSVR